MQASSSEIEAGKDPVRERVKFFQDRNCNKKDKFPHRSVPLNFSPYVCFVFDQPTVCVCRITTVSMRCHQPNHSQ
jgi:hypothetical protein